MLSEENLAKTLSRADILVNAPGIGMSPEAEETPVFNTLDGDLAKALLAIPAVKGVEFGADFAVVEKKGS